MVVKGPARPERTYRTGAWTRWVRRGSVVIAIGFTAFLLAVYPSLPETIPTHFALTGEPDAFGPRASILLMAGILLALVLGMAWLSGHPRVFNYPLPVTEANAQRLYREGERLLVWVTLCVLLLYVGTALSALGVGGVLFVTGGLAGLVVSLVVGLVRMASAGRAGEPVVPEVAAD